MTTKNRMLFILSVTVLLWVGLVMLPGCSVNGTPAEVTTTSIAPINNPPVEELAERKLKLYANQAWTDAMLDEIKLTGLGSIPAADLVSFCKNSNSLSKTEKEAVWAHIIFEMSKWESNLDPKSSMYECRKDKCIYSGGCQYSASKGYCMKGGHPLDGGLVVSRGLLQISLQSAQYYGCKDIASVPADLHDPIKNLKCSVRIIKTLVAKSQAVAGKDSSGNWRGVARYWAVVRGTTDYTAKSLVAIKKQSQLAPKCN